MYQTPKTNWISADPINYTDYGRIIGNISFIKYMSDALFRNMPTLEDMPIKNAYTDIPYADDWNAIENNLETINRYTVNVPIGETVTFQSNSYFINYMELNRVERGIELIHDSLKPQYDLIPKLAIRLGGSKFKF